jgi:hypothetical protein
MLTLLKVFFLVVAKVFGILLKIPFGMVPCVCFVCVCVCVCVLSGGGTSYALLKIIFERPRFKADQLNSSVSGRK